MAQRQVPKCHYYSVVAYRHWTRILFWGYWDDAVGNPAF